MPPLLSAARACTGGAHGADAAREGCNEGTELVRLSAPPPPPETPPPATVPADNAAAEQGNDYHGGDYYDGGEGGWFFYDLDNVQRGPVATERITYLRDEGVVHDGTYVWCAGACEEWTPLGESPLAAAWRLESRSRIAM
jgi:hypothetical protein